MFGPPSATPRAILGHRSAELFFEVSRGYCRNGAPRDGMTSGRRWPRRESRREARWLGGLRWRCRRPPEGTTSSGCGRAPGRLPKRPRRTLGLLPFARGLLEKLRGAGVGGGMVPKGGVEPPRVAPHAPQTCASASSATSARGKVSQLGPGLSTGKIPRISLALGRPNRGMAGMAGLRRARGVGYSGYIIPCRRG